MKCVVYFSALFHCHPVRKHPSVQWRTMKCRIFASKIVSSSTIQGQPSNILDYLFSPNSRQFFLSELLARSNPITVHIIAHDYTTNAQQVHSPAFYQRPQIKHESDLVASAPYGYVETPFDLNERYKRNAKSSI